MSKLSPIRARDLIRILDKLGFERVRQKGSHLRVKHPDGRKTSIPIHSGEKVGSEELEVGRPKQKREQEKFRLVADS